MIELDVMTAPRRNSRHWKLGKISWSTLVSWAEKPARVREAGNYVFGKMTLTTTTHPGEDETCTAFHRKKGAIASRSAVTLDVDYPEPGLVEKVDLILGYKSLIHTTYSSTKDSPRYRIIIPTDRDMKPDEYIGVCTVVMNTLGYEQFDPSTTQPERYMFRPGTATPEDYGYWEIEGELLSVDDALEAYEPSELPTPKLSPNKRSPYELGGVVGAFNRAYDIPTVIEKFDLPYVRAGADRWQLVGADGAAGMGPISDGLVYSHHSNDPAAGVACSAFDLVRLHRFADLDEDISPNTPVNRRPSHKAMMDLASEDANVIKETVGADFADAMTGSDWMLGLNLNPRTGKMRDTIDNWDLIRENDPVFLGLYFNEMTMAVESHTDFPWRPMSQGGPIVSHMDRTAFAHHLERTYGIRPNRQFVDGLIDTVAQQRYVNPLRDYLNSLEWDGKPRVETSLPGVKPTKYTRMVARKSLVAAVARMLEPGIKWDHTLVLFGSEGIGKSWWVSRISRGYSATLGRIGDKDTLLAMRRSWIMLSDEGYSLRKADNDAQKEFLTRTTDVFRMPYERESLAHPRHCVIWGTTNDEVFLRNQEGNRRFLIVRCEEKVDFDALTDEYVDQLWAEAVHLYKNGEPLFLSLEESELAADNREQFIEEDVLVGLIKEYLDTPVPENWDEMSPSARSLWMANRADGMVPEGQILQDTVCSIQVWVEVLGRRRGEHTRTDLLNIYKSLRSIPGWSPQPGKERVPNYGSQSILQRDPE